MDRATLEARRDELRAQLRQAEASTLRLQGALALIQELLDGYGNTGTTDRTDASTK